jgi:hypothetical protein
MRRRRVALGLVAMLAIAIPTAMAVGRTGVAPLPRRPADGVVTIALDRTVNKFDGRKLFGAGVDGLEAGEISRVWTLANTEAMKSAGYGPITYRLRTELGAKAWHWNAEGTWRDPHQQQGYWTSSSTAATGAGVSYGYGLPRRGNTIDQAKNDGYSRLDDGSSRTFWKSNPYLDSHFTGEPDDRQPQWIMVEFGEPVGADTMRIDWGAPYATAFRVQYWTARTRISRSRTALGGTSPLARTTVTEGCRRCPSPKRHKITYVRILMTADSDTAPAGSTDVRDRLGYAVDELYMGRTEGGSFVDEIAHGPSQ